MSSVASAAMPSIMIALDDPVERVRKSFLYALGAIQSKAALPYLLAALKSAQGRSQVLIAESMCVISPENEHSLPALVTALQGEKKICA